MQKRWQQEKEPEFAEAFGCRKKSILTAVGQQIPYEDFLNEIKILNYVDTQGCLCISVSVLLACIFARNFTS